MFHSLLPFRRLLATTFLVVFVNLCLGQCWCPAMAAAKSAQAGQRMPAGCQMHGKAADARLHGAGASKKQLSANHDCCKGKSTAKQAVVAPTKALPKVSQAPALLPEHTDFFAQPAAGPWDRTAAVVLVARQVLPPKIPDIRIFIRSLTI